MKRPNSSRNLDMAIRRITRKPATPKSVPPQYVMEPFDMPYFRGYLADLLATYSREKRLFLHNPEN